MTISKKTLGIWMAVAAILTLGLSQVAFAAGTMAGTSVENRATIDYQVGGNAQTLIESSATGNATPGAGAGSDTTFLVDNKVDLTVAEQIATYVSVTPNQQDAYLTFIVKNEGNYVQDYVLSAAHNATDPFGGTESFDATGLTVFVESDANAGYQVGEDTAIFIDELAPDASKTVYIVGDIPAAQVNGDISAITLTATTHDGGLAGQGALTANAEGAADDPATVQVVFADDAGDTDTQYNGAFSDTGAFKVASAALTVTKTSTVISDPVNGISTDAKAIPGAIIEYTITVANAAGSGNTATAIQVQDSLNTEITAGTLAFNDGTIKVTAPNINGGSEKSLTNAIDGDEGQWAANTVTVTGIDLAPGATATVTFQVTVK